MTVSWALHVRGTAGGRVALLTDWQEATFTSRFNAVGAWTLKAGATAAIQQMGYGGGLIVTRDGGDGSGPQTVFSGPPTKIQRDWDSIGDRYAITGADDLCWLNRRICYPEAPNLTTATNAYDASSNYASTVLMHYVDVNVGASSATANRQRVTCGPDYVLGSAVKGNARFDNLLTLCGQLAAADGTVGFRCVDVASTFPQFQVFTIRDQSSSARFSTDLNNIASGRQIVELSQANRALVAGGGVGTARTFVTVDDPVDQANIGSIAETFVDGRDTTDTTTLRQRGTAQLASSAQKTSIAVTVKDTASLQWWRDWQVGDTVSVDIRGTWYKAQVQAVTVTLNTSGATITPVLGNLSATVSPLPGIFDRGVAPLSARLLNLERQ